MKCTQALRVLFLALAAVAIAAGGYWFGQHPQPASPVTASHPAKATREILYWHDPMVPGTHFDKPGKSPFMDMQLVPVYADETKGQDAVVIDPRVQQNLGLRVAEVTAQSMEVRWTAVGSVAWDERSIDMVTARSAGYLERLLVWAPYEAVRAGQPLAELYVPDWVAAQEDFLAVRRMAHGEDLLEAARQRMRLAGMTPDQIAAVEHAGHVQPRMTVRAPRAGQVVELTAREGMTFAAGTPLFRLASLDRVWVNAELPEQAMARIGPGATVDVTVPALGATVWTGRIAALLPDIDPATRTRKARIELANPGQRLQPGMFVNVTLHAPSEQPVLSVPSEAVIQTGTRSLVYVAEEGGRSRPVEIRTGREAGGRTEVLAGLAARQKVVVSAQFLLDSEATLRGIEAAPLPAASATAMPRMPTMAMEPMPPHAAPVARGLASSPRAPSLAPAPTENSATVAAVPPAAAPVQHHGTGRIEKLGPDSVTLSHGPIPSLAWPPMTMDFALAPELAKGLQAGQIVDFTFHRDGHGFRIDAITPARQPDGSKP